MLILKHIPSECKRYNSVATNTIQKMTNGSQDICPTVSVEHDENYHTNAWASSKHYTISDNGLMFLDVFVFPDRCVEYALIDNQNHPQYVSFCDWSRDEYNMPPVVENVKCSKVKIKLSEKQIKTLVNWYSAKNTDIGQLQIKNIEHGLVLATQDGSADQDLQMLYLSWSTYNNLQKIKENIDLELTFMLPYIHLSKTPNCMINNKHVIKHLMVAIASKIYGYSFLCLLQPKLKGESKFQRKLSAVKRISFEQIEAMLSRSNHSVDSEVIKHMLANECEEIACFISKNYVCSGAAFFTNHLTYADCGYHALVM